MRSPLPFTILGVATSAMAVSACLDFQEAVPLDPRTGECGIPGEYEGAPFPPPDRTIGISAVEVADVNADGISDLIFLNNSDVPQKDQGFFILLGPEKENDLQFHAFVATVSDPFAIEVFNFAGDACLDISIFGTAKEGPPTGIIEIWENVGPRPMFANDPSSTKDVEFEPNSSSMHIEVGTLGTDGFQNDIAVADNNNLVVLSLSGNDFTGLALATPRHLDPSANDVAGQWTDIQGLAFEQSKPITDFDDILIVERENAAWLANMGDAAFRMLGTGSSLGAFDLGTLAVADLDGNDTPDLIGGSNDDFGAYLLERTGSAANIVSSEWSGGALAGVTELEAITVANLGQGLAPEVIILDREVGASRAMVLVDAAVTNGSLGPSDPQVLDFQDIDPGLGVFVDFNGDTLKELLVIDPATGAFECLALIQGTLAFCGD